MKAIPFRMARLSVSLRYLKRHPEEVSISDEAWMELLIYAKREAAAMDDLDD